MSQKPPSQFRVLLLLAASLAAGLLASTSLSQREVTHTDSSTPLRGCDFIGWDRLPACQKYGDNDRLEAYPTIFSQPLREQPLIAESP
jgi:hypothetical protein